MAGTQVKTPPADAGATFDVPARAKRVAVLADEHAAAADRQGQLSAPVVEALHREGLYGIWVPKSVRGGLELDVVSSVKVIENLSYGDPSTAWVLMAGALATGTGAAYLQQAAVDELFKSERLPAIAGQGTRPGKATPHDGGFLLSGSWSFASGIKHASHIHTLGLIEGTNEPRIFVLPVGQATLIDNWDVLGLRGTGSIDYRIDDVFVPDAYTHFAGAASSPRGGGLFSIGIAGFACICHSGWASGLARRMLDELAERSRGGVGRTGSLAESESFHEQFARVEGTYRAARALVLETWSSVRDTLDRGEALTHEQQTMMRLGMAHITWTAHEVAEFVYTTAGTLSLRSGTIQRLFRDMHAGTQHIVCAPPLFRKMGQVLSGLAPTKQWAFLDLVDKA